MIGKKIDTGNIKKSADLILNSGIGHEFRTTIASCLLTPEDIMEIAKTIKGAQTLALQKFIPASGSDLKEGTFSDETFQKLKTETEKYVNTCLIR